MINMSYKQERIDQVINTLNLNHGFHYIYKDKRYQFVKHYQDKKYVLLGEEGDIIPVVEMPLIELASIKPYVWKIDEAKIKLLKEINRYNLKPNDILKAKVIDPEKLKQEPFWRNEQIKAWCLSGGAGHSAYSGGSLSSYWIGFYDDGKIKYDISCMEDMCNYKIEEFFNLSDIENEYDETIQIKYLKRLNWLIDEEIIEIEGIENGK